MTPDDQLTRIANAIAEEVLRVIYGDDLRGCEVSPDSIATVIRAGIVEHSNAAGELNELHAKAFEAVQLLATPPAHGPALSPEDLRSLLGERLDKIRDLSGRVLNATKSAAYPAPANGTSDLGR